MPRPRRNDIATNGDVQVCIMARKKRSKNYRVLNFLKFRIYSDFRAIELSSYDTVRILQYSKSEFAREKRSNFCLQQFFFTPSLALA